MMKRNDPIQIEQGRGGFCLLTLRDEDETYSMPLVYWPEIESTVRADFYKWLALVKAHAQTQAALQSIREAIANDPQAPSFPA